MFSCKHTLSYFDVEERRLFFWSLLPVLVTDPFDRGEPVGTWDTGIVLDPRGSACH